MTRTTSWAVHRAEQQVLLFAYGLKLLRLRCSGNSVVCTSFGIPTRTFDRKEIWWTAAEAVVGGGTCWFGIKRFRCCLLFSIGWQSEVYLAQSRHTGIEWHDMWCTAKRKGVCKPAETNRGGSVPRSSGLVSLVVSVSSRLVSSLLIIRCSYTNFTLLSIFWHLI